MRKYRIIKSREFPGQFEVQHRHRWWPFWLYTDTATTHEAARQAAAGHAIIGKTVEDLGWLPAPAETESHD